MEPLILSASAERGRMLPDGVSYRESWVASILRNDLADSTTDHLGELWATQLPGLPIEGGEVFGVIEDLHRKVVFALEVIVEGGLGHADFIDDAVEPDGGEPISVEQVVCSLQQAFTGGRGHATDPWMAAGWLTSRANSLGLTSSQLKVHRESSVIRATSTVCFP